MILALLIGAQVASSAPATNSASRLPIDERTSVVNNIFYSFKTMDENHDKAISRSEWTRAYPKFDIGVAGVRLSADAIVAKFFNADTDKNGTISLSEYKQFIIKQFDCLDRDKNGFLDPAERLAPCAAL